MPEKPKHNPTPAPAPGSNPTPGKSPARADGNSRGHDSAPAHAPGNFSGSASAPGNASTPGKVSGQGSADNNASASGNTTGAGNAHHSATGNTTNSANTNNSAGNATPARDQSRNAKHDGKAKQTRTKNAKPRSGTSAAGSTKTSKMPGTRETTSAIPSDTHGKTTCGSEFSGGPAGDADALRFVDTADVLSQFTQIEGRFTQVKQGLAHLQRLATLGTLTATLIHEFNNILTPITSYAQLALLKPDDKALARKTHEKTLDAANRATKLCAALLGYAREEDEHTPARAQLDEVVHASLACLGNGLASRGIDVVLELTDAQAAISPAGLEQVLVNLILNARKAMLDAGGTLTIRTRCDQSSVRIEVADTGPGVPAHIADRVFEPFVTAPPQAGASGIGCRVSGVGEEGDESGIGVGGSGFGVGEEAGEAGQSGGNSGGGDGGNASGGSGGNSGGGTGLGLSVCRDLVRRAGGDIGFESRPGEGTTFHITLPKAEPVRRAG